MHPDHDPSTWKLLFLVLRRDLCCNMCLNVIERLWRPKSIRRYDDHIKLSSSYQMSWLVNRIYPFLVRTDQLFLLHCSQTRYVAWEEFGKKMRGNEDRRIRRLDRMALSLCPSQDVQCPLITCYVFVNVALCRTSCLLPWLFPLLIFILSMRQFFLPFLSCVVFCFVKGVWRKERALTTYANSRVHWCTGKSAKPLTDACWNGAMARYIPQTPLPYC